MSIARTRYVPREEGADGQARETLCMMMEGEIERTREEIRAIGEACDRVEGMLDLVTRSHDLAATGENVTLTEGDVTTTEGQDVTAQRTEGDQMEDVTNELQPPDEPPKPLLSPSRWFNDQSLLDLWNGA
jgi:MED7 protein